MTLTFLILDKVGNLITQLAVKTVILLLLKEPSIITGTAALKTGSRVDSYNLDTYLPG